MGTHRHPGRARGLSRQRSQPMESDVGGLVELKASNARLERATEAALAASHAKSAFLAKSRDSHADEARDRHGRSALHELSGL